MKEKNILLPEENVLRETLSIQSALDCVLIDPRKKWLRMTTLLKKSSSDLDIFKIDNGQEIIYILFLLSSESW